MTEYTKSKKELEELKLISEKLLNCQTADLKFAIADFKELQNRIEGLEGTVNKMRARAAEKDKDKQTYGEKMRANVSELVDQFDVLYDAYAEELLMQFEHLLKEDEMQKTKEDEAATNARKEAFETQISEQQTITLKEEEERLIKLKENQELINTRLKEEADLESRRLQQLALREEELRSILTELSEFEYQMRCRSPVCMLGQAFLRMLTLANWKDFKNAAFSFAEFFTRIVSQPNETALRVLRIRNPKFLEHFGSIPGGILVFRAAGFQLVNQDSAKEELAKIRQSGIQMDVNDSPELYLILKEPDPLMDYEDWKVWMYHLQQMRDMIEYISTESRRLQAPLSSNFDALAVESMTSVVHLARVKFDWAAKE